MITKTQCLFVMDMSPSSTSYEYDIENMIMILQYLTLLETFFGQTTKREVSNQDFNETSIGKKCLNKKLNL